MEMEMEMEMENGKHQDILIIAMDHHQIYHQLFHLKQ